MNVLSLLRDAEKAFERDGHERDIRFDVYGWRKWRVVST